jgi:NADP+-dependent farnesol dehydrogenase
MGRQGCCSDRCQFWNRCGNRRSSGPTRPHCEYFFSKENSYSLAQVVGIARRVHLIEELSKKLSTTKLYALQADLSREEEIVKAFKWVGENLGPVHILVNSAGIFDLGLLSKSKTEAWKNLFDINVLGLCIATREAVTMMKANDIQGHIIHMNSVSGHNVPQSAKMNVYPATKHAVTALTRTLRQELNQMQSKIKVTVIVESRVVQMRKEDDCCRVSVQVW